MNYQKNKFKKLIRISLIASFAVVVSFLITPSIAVAETLVCGTTITTSTTLDSDMFCSGTGITIGADNIVLDCAGHSITGTGPDISMYRGIYLFGRTGVTVKNCVVTNFGAGITIESGSYNTLTGNTASSNVWPGIELQSSSHNTLTSNTAINNGQFGFGIFESTYNTLTNNTVDSNKRNDIQLSTSSYNILTGNVVKNSLNGGISLGVSSEHNLITGNTINNNAREGIWTDSSFNEITNNNIHNNNGQGISIQSYDSVSSSGNIVSNNTVESNGANGISLGNFDDNPITDVTPDNNVISDNNINSNGGNGVSIHSVFGNTLTGNTISDNEFGIDIYSSSDNTIINNTVNLNSYGGIRLTNSSDNNIFNNLFNNNVNVNVDSPNFWNTTKTIGTNIIGGYFMGGNAWSTPSGNGYSQTCTDANSDGICDSEYTLAIDNIDYLPLAVGVSCPSGMVSYWKFDEGSGTIAFDSVDSHPGTLVGPVWITGQVGNALQFDSTSWVSMSDNGLPIGSDPRTVEAWIKTTDAGIGAIFVYGTPFEYGQLYYVGKNYPPGENNIRASQWGAGVETYGVNAMDGNWHHIAVRSDGSGNYEIYVDGVLRGSGYMLTNTVLSGIATIGAYKVYYEGTDQFIGQIDEVAIYNRALSSEEIQQQYQNGLGGKGYCFDPDNDNDEVLDKIDNCLGVFNPDQLDTDSDGMGNACDLDDDNDGILDVNDLCPFEDASGFDANNDGCIDTIGGLQQIINTLPVDVLSDEIKNSLVSKIDNALKSVEKENDEAAINMLGAFINQIEAQRGKKISEEAADMLIAYANNVIAQIKK